MGSSRAIFALVPDVFGTVTGRSSYNFGISNSKSLEWQILCRELFSQGSPRLVVFGVNAGEFGSDYIPTQAASHLCDLADLADSCRRDGVSSEVVGLYARRELGRAWAAFGRRYELKMWSTESLGPLMPRYAQSARKLRERVAKPVPPDGYKHPWSETTRRRDLQQRLDDGDNDLHDQFVIPTFAENASPFNRFDDTLRDLRRLGVEVAVVYLPNSPRTESRWIDVEPRFIARINEICRGRGVCFIQLGQDRLPRGNRDFMDEIHVGLPLARRLSEHVAIRLMQLDLVGDDGG